ncbi:hypothetical protein Ac2012v2_005260 [Leucoagaricus gongylophorus]
MPSTKALTNIKNHDSYYIKGGDLSILVDDTRFLVPSYFFSRESPDFKERLQAKASANDISKSSGHVQTIQEIIIHADENVTPDDFAQLCWVFFNEKISIYETTIENWQTILRLASQYKFAEVKELAFREIDKPGVFDMSIVDRIILYRKYNADRNYLEKLYVELLGRPEPLTIEEGDKLSLKLALLISGARERLRATSDKLALSDPLPETMIDTIKAMVVSMFWDGPTLDSSLLLTTARMGK